MSMRFARSSITYRRAVVNRDTPETHSDTASPCKKLVSGFKRLFVVINRLQKHISPFDRSCSAPISIGDPCQPSPCGPNSRCRNVNGKASCSCLSTYQGTPPDCRPECIVNTECPMNRACINQRCVDPCPGVCGINAKCDVLSHSPFCSCGPGQIGDPFVKCFDMPRKSQKKFTARTSHH